jgi:hypothetical protein
MARRRFGRAVRFVTRPIASAVRSASAWVSIRWPLVWRTRLLMYVALSAGATLLASAAADSVWTTRADLPTLSGSLFYFRALATVTNGLVLLMLLDVGRRTRPVFRPFLLARLFVCVALAASAIQLPNFIFMRSLIPRFAAFETAGELPALLARNRPQGFWRCQAGPRPTGDPRADVRRVDPGLRAMLGRDLQRYGLATNFLFVFDYRGRECLDRSRQDRGAWWSVLAWREGGQPPTEEALFRLRMTNAITLFEGRLTLIEAAHQYARSNGPYMDVLSPGRFLVIALLAGTAVTLWTWLALARARILANSRRVAAAFRWRPTFPFDERLARRWPILWASRAARALVPVLALCLAIFWIQIGEADVSTTTQSLIFLAALLAVLASQGGAASWPGTLRAQSAIALIYAAMVLGLSLVASQSFISDRWLSLEDVMLAVMMSILVCGVIQARRTGSISTTFGAMVLASVATMVSMAFDPNGQFEFVKTYVLSTIVLAGVVGYAMRRRSGPTLVRLLMGTLFIQAAAINVWGLNAFEDQMDEWSAPIQATAFVLLVAASVAMTIATLYFTANARRTLAHSGK